MPNYPVHLPGQNDSIVCIDVEEELNERVNIGDLDGDGGNARDFDDTMNEIKL